AEAAVEKRLALVIGNAAYPTAALKNPVNDARAMAAALRQLGFDVAAHENLTQAQMQRAIIAFGEHLGPDTVALFYYSGHGQQVFKRVRASVVTASHDLQTPWETSSLIGEFYFSKPRDVAPAASAAAASKPENVVAAVTVPKIAGTGKTFKDCALCPHMTVLL